MIELMVVLMTIGLLIAIAIPTFLGFRGGAQDTAAQATLTTAEKVVFLVILEERAVPGRAALLALLPTLEPSIQWLDHRDSSSGPSQVSIDNKGTDELVLATLSESGSCFWLRLGDVSVVAKGFVEAAAKCEGHDFKDSADTGW